MTDDANEPVHLVEDGDTGDRFLVYSRKDGVELDIRFEGETLWMTQAQIAELFGRDVSTISRHIAKVIEEGELDEASSLQKMQTTVGRPSVIYNLDMVISVGYRVSSTQATLFRRWATGVLVQYARKGFVVDARRLKEAESGDRIRELREIIQDIRADEANVYRELKAICAMCQDYDPASEIAREFYQRTQAKLVYAVVSHTPAETIWNRVDADAPNLGLESWAGDNIRKVDVIVSKNYLGEREMRELNRLTTILLDIFDDQLDIGRLVTMDDAKQLLDVQLKQLGRAVLNSGGSISMADAKKKAEAEYDRFKARQKAETHRLADEAIAALVDEAKRLPKSPRTKPPKKP